MPSENSRRILVVDDDPTIRHMMSSLLRNAARNETSSASKNTANAESPFSDVEPFEYVVDTADQGEEALTLVKAAINAGDPYLMAFIDLRMPPGWNGIETMLQLWEQDESLQIALCSAYSDYSWEDILSRAGRRSNLLILKKPFDYSEAAQMALALSEKGLLTRKTAERMENLERMVSNHTCVLEDTNRRLSSSILVKEKARDEATEMLETTVNSIASVLVSMIEMGNPLAFSHAKRIQAHTALLVAKLGLPKPWTYDLAAILSQLGCATIPEGTLRKYFSGEEISFEERSMVLAYPAVSADLISKIPQLDSVAAMMGFRDKLGNAEQIDFSFVGPVEAGAWILRTAIDFDILLSRHSKKDSIEMMRKDPSEYPKMLLDLLEEYAPDNPTHVGELVKTPLLALDKEMVLNENLLSRDGVVIAHKAQRLTEPLLKRIHNYIQAGLIETELVEVIQPGDMEF